MTFKKGYYIGLLLGLVSVFAGVLYVNKVTNAIENVDEIKLENLSLKDLTGNSVKISDYGGDKHVLVNFWATWCKPCIEEFPVLSDVQKIVNDEFEFIVISDEENEKIKQFANKENYKFTYLKTDKLPLGINSLPQTYVLNKKLERKKYYAGAIEGNVPEIVDSLRVWINKE